jgi:hypothetical protein
MTDEEKDEATNCRICHPPPCKCGYLLELAKPPLRLDYTPFELGYGYLYCNVVGEDDAWVSSKTQAFIINHLYVQSPSLMMIFCIEFFLAAYKNVRLGVIHGPRGIS